MKWNVCWAKAPLLAGVYFFIALALTAATTWAASTPTVKGTGYAREDEASCNRELPALKTKLSKLGLQVKKIECLSVDGQVDAFEPVFDVASAGPIQFNTAQAIYSPSREGCEKTLRGMLSVVLDSDEVLVEASCSPLTIVESEEGAASGDFYQPVAILMKRGRKPIPEALDFAAAD